jgi:hypothetical protein
MFDRKMSPVEIVGMSKLLAMRAAWVPLPAPGGPTMSSARHRRRPS